MKRHSESGVALLSAILVLMLMSAMVVGFMAMVDADQRATMINRDQTQAYAAAHAGVEKLTADLGQLFTQVTYSPTGAQINALTGAGMEPTLPGVSYVRPEGGSGYRITFTDETGANGLGGPDGIPDVDRVDGTPIRSGPFDGLRGLMTKYDIEVTARAPGTAEVRMKREIQTVGVPVFQFGMFSENSLSFFAGPNFSFGGRVHTNEHLFLAQESPNTLTLQDRVSAVGEIIRKRLSNGMAGTHTGTVRMALAAGCPAAPTAINGACRNLLDTEGSQVDGLGSDDNEPTWWGVSTDDYGGWISNGRTGARRLDLQIVRDGAQPVDLIRVPPLGEATNSPVGRQRFYNMASVRILLADDALTLQGHPGAVGNPVQLSGSFGPLAVLNGLPLGIPPLGLYPFATSGGLPLVNLGFRTIAGQSTIGGFILINKQNKNGVWTDVTRDILSLGFTGRRLSTGNLALGNLDQPDMENSCSEYHANAVIRVQRVSDVSPNNLGVLPLLPPGCGPLLNVVPSTGLDFWPNVLYDPREGMLRDDEAARPPNAPVTQWPRMYFGGVMYYVELDVNNLRRWLYGEIGNANAGCPSGNATATCPMDVTGYVAYFSDRRTNRNIANQETGEFGWEDNINRNAAGNPNGVLDGPYVDAAAVDRWAEDINQNDALETYGNVARTGVMIDPALILPASLTARNIANYSLWQNPIDRNVARINQAFFFRRALKLTHGGRGNLPRNGNQGLTVAAENPVYVEGNYNACNNNSPNEVGGVVPRFANAYGTQCVGGVGFGNAPGVDHVSAAVIADAVTLLSNTWNDIKSFRNPHATDVTDYYPLEDNTVASPSARQAVDTWYRLGIIAGKGLGFPRANYASANDNDDFGTDGGAHNFLRYIENWDAGNPTLNYRGSLISFYTSRQATGIYKCCTIVYSPPSRGYAFDTDFSDPRLLPPRTPMFRDLNTLTFRQILRPTQQ